MCESMDDMYGERAAQGSRLICCGCEKDGNNCRKFTAKVVKSVFVGFATRGHDILYSDWGRRYSIDLYIALNFLRVLSQSARYFHTVNYHCFNYCQ